MRFNDLLLALTSYPEPTPFSHVEQAVAFAEVLGSHISAVTYEIEIPRPISFYTDAVLNISGMIEEARVKSAANARDLMHAFEAEATRRNVAHEQIAEHCTGADVPELLTAQARLRDLTLIPLRNTDSVEQWYAERVIFDSGRPTLVLPERVQASSFGTIAIAWDSSRPAARALGDALPLLERAKQVRVFTITNEKALTPRGSGQLAKHLARHKVEAVLENVDAEGRSIGEVLEAYVRSRDIDLLVMGAYGHSRLRDFILGGATRSMLARPPVPVFLSH